MSEALIDATWRWLQQVVVGLNLCPFAAGPLRAGTIRMTCCGDADWNTMLERLAEEATRLMQWEPSEVSTTLLLLPSVGSFGDLLDVVGAGEALLQALSLSEEVQLVAFHPDFQYQENPDPNDPANLTNRSPTPLIHLLRTADVAEVVAQHPDTTAIPLANAVLLRAMGHDAVDALWRST